ncbi:XK-related protein 4 isoform X1 [Anastrepha ludens]|uniref:XK-related protein 4 isoform X1 n=1 Tax=Anastrepha ludens TaxID=28586 RepID=UPI0023B077AD|nr:XK-related protein 4 isoform X1 [Anastrepha ludens]
MESISALLDLMRLARMQFIQKSTLPDCIETEANGADADDVDAGTHMWKEKTVSYKDIAATVISILMRVITVLLNIKLAVDYYQQGQHNYFVWTVVCIVVPMLVTAFIYAQMCHQDNKFEGGFWEISQTILLVIFSSFFLRYWNSLIYSVKCKRSELQGSRDEQLEYYKLTVKEESDVALIRLFECFMETAPLKILLMSIMLTQENQITDTQIWSVLVYLVNVPWTLASYNRCIRAVQPLKNKLRYLYMVPHLCWHFCISVSRILCITFVTILFPIWMIVACLLHAIIMGFVTYIIERPQFSGIIGFHNFLFCLALGLIYLFIYIPVKDTPTRYKYALYYAICSVENIICVVLFIYYAPENLSKSTALFYTLCTLAIGFYYVGICCMCIYYMYFHPNVKARKNINLNISNEFCKQNLPNDF